MVKEKHEESSVSLFMRGFFSVMSYPFIFDHPEIEAAKENGGRRKNVAEAMAHEGVGRHFARVGRLLSDAYGREMDSVGFKK
ncbi:MAG: hypothetical protein FWF84_06430 [Kiritimatiellaeota bacterium]|nr:hypothetical protein [Kiritimatiellota bacterium]